MGPTDSTKAPAGTVLCDFGTDIERNAVHGSDAAATAKLEIVGLKRIALDDRLARGFYAVHKQRPFFADLVKFMTSGPVIVMALEGADAIRRWRDLMGPTNSKQAPKGTIRGDFGTDIERNATHGSDAPETAKAEIGFFFSGAELAALDNHAH